MIVGKLLIVLALIATIFSGWKYWTAAITTDHRQKNGKTENDPFARVSFYVMGGLVALAALYLLVLILTHQFQVNYVYRYSSRELPLGFLISSFWAGQEGSFLLWAFLIALMGMVFIRTAGEFEPHAMLVINIVQGFFLAILLKASPFEILPQTPPNGAGLNPLLQNPWMVIHPPMLFLGYAAAAFPFALAVAALAQRRYTAFIARALPWAVFTSLTLGAGIIIGGYWAYKVLGWGGYWGWDPVENSSLVPWLTILAFIHGLLVQRKTGALTKSNLLLAIISFALVIYATFLTRSGVLADFSVHSFQDLGINLYLIAFMITTLGIGLWQFAKNFREIPCNELNLINLNRETILLASMLVFSISAFITFLGTSSPIFTGLIGNPAQVDVSFYNTVHLPIGIALALFLGLAPYLRWNLTENLLKSLTSSILLTAVSSALAIWAGMRETMPLSFYTAATFAFWSNLLVTLKLLKIDWRYVAAPLSHVGVALLLIGIIVSAVFENSQQIVLKKGTPVQAMGYELTYVDVTPVLNGKNIVNIMVASENENYLAKPRFYYSEYNRSVMREPDVKAGILGDLYLSPLDIRQPDQTSLNSTVLRIAKGETKPFRDLQITFNEFDLYNHTETNDLKVGARLTINTGEKTFQITPAVDFEQGKGRTENGEFILDRRGGAQKITVVLNGLDANQKMIELLFEGFEKDASTESEAQEQLIVELSNKPFMSAIWFGAILITLGAVIALRNRVQTPVNTTKNDEERYHGTHKEMSGMPNR
jgi:cytochrome c-type biogenesis protein CcmF